MTSHLALVLSSHNKANSSDESIKCKAKEQMTISSIGLGLSEVVDGLSSSSFRLLDMESYGLAPSS